MQELLDQLGVSLPVAIGVTAAMLATLISVVVLFQTFKKKRPEPPPSVDLSIDLAALGEAGPPPATASGESAILELYHIPVRLAGLVVAPTGRGGSVPDDEQLGELLDAVVPGLAAVLRVHRPQIIRWEPQLSTQGFSTTLFANVHLPGDKGRGTPWCAVSGRCEAGEQKLLLGLICRAAAPNSLAHLTVQRESQWLDVLRVHSYSRSAMTRTVEQMLRDARAIWDAGVAAVRSDHLVAEALQIDGQWLHVYDEEPIDLRTIEHIEVVGAGKAGAGMAAGVLAALGPELAQAKQLSGWINVPADCVTSGFGTNASPIHLHAARPAGVNEPSEAGIRGSEEILRRVAALGPRDLCLVLISGGGSALLPAPVAGITLVDKLTVTRLLSAAGANISELNAVRKPLSRIKGGGLARACRAGRLVALIISDVLGDPLDVIASGPTVPSLTTAADALAVLRKYAPNRNSVPAAVWQVLEGMPQQSSNDFPASVSNIVIGNNAVAVDAAGLMAERLGYSHAMTSSRQCEDQADDVGEHLADMALHMRATAGPDCLVSGGEPVVKLAAAAERGRGGRNQQLVLAALMRLDKLAGHEGKTGQGIVLLSGGTDGEDGPTDAAGAVLDPRTWQAAEALGLDPADFLRRNDAYTFWQAVGGLIRTGPTHTNVCDLRVVLVDRVELAERA